MLEDGDDLAREPDALDDDEDADEDADEDSEESAGDGPAELLEASFTTRTLKGERRGPRRRTESWRRTSKAVIEARRREYEQYREFHGLHPLPGTLGECAEERPCPHTSCKYHLAYDVTEKGNLVHNFPGMELHELDFTCTFDVVDPEGATFEVVGRAMNLTRARVEQIETKALAKINATLTPEEKEQFRELLRQEYRFRFEDRRPQKLIEPRMLVRREKVLSPPKQERVRPARSPQERVVVVAAEPEELPAPVPAPAAAVPEPEPLVVPEPFVEAVVHADPKPEPSKGPRLVPPPAEFREANGSVWYGDQEFHTMPVQARIEALVTAYGTASVLAKSTGIGETTLSGIRRGKTNAGPWVEARLAEAARARVENRQVRAVPASPLARRGNKRKTGKPNRAEAAPAPVQLPGQSLEPVRKGPSKSKVHGAPHVVLDGKLVSVQATLSLQDAKSLYHFARTRGLLELATALSDVLIER